MSSNCFFLSNLTNLCSACCGWVCKRSPVKTFKSKLKMNTVIKAYKLLMGIGLVLLWNVLVKFAIHYQEAKIHISLRNLKNSGRTGLNLHVMLFWGEGLLQY